MIVLDEQLIGDPVPDEIRHWYRGHVTTIVQLRPGTIILDDAIPTLLRTDRQPTFVTINVTDFWRKTAPDQGFCIVCLAITDRQVRDVSALLRRLFTVPQFKTRRGRLGKIIRVSSGQILFYSTDSWRIQVLNW